MASGTPLPAQCCDPCESQPTTQIPGPAGAAGAAGAAGSNGENAFTTVTVNYTQPAVGADVTVTVLDSDWAAISQYVYVTTGGSYTVQAKPTGTTITIRNLGYSGNAAPAAGITAPRQMSPAGIKGVDGGAGSTDLDVIIDATFGATSARGQLLVDNGAATPNSNAVKLAVGTNGQIMCALSTDPTGVDWRSVIPNAATDNVISRFDGAVGTPVPLQTSNMVLTDNGVFQSSPTGGNARGTDATDLQIVRGGAAQVASGTRSGILSGQNNTASGTDSTVVGGASNIASGTRASVGGGNLNAASNTDCSIIGGTGNTASGLGSSIAGGLSNSATGQYSVIGGGSLNTASSDSAGVNSGSDNTSSGTGSFIGGGVNNTASGDYSSVYGGLRGVADHYGQTSQSSGRFAADGDAQTSSLVMRGSTANGAATEIFLDGAASRMTLPDDTTWTFRMLIVARRTDANDESAAYQLLGCIDRNVGVGTTALVGAVTKTVIAEDTAAWDVAATADAANGALILTVTGEAAKTLRWVAKVELIQVTG